jgi:hypothetical protein
MARSGIPLPDIEHLLRRGGRPIPLLAGLLVTGVEEGLGRREEQECSVTSLLSMQSETLRGSELRPAARAESSSWTAA